MKNRTRLAFFHKSGKNSRSRVCIKYPLRIVFQGICNLWVTKHAIIKVKDLSEGSTPTLSSPDYSCMSRLGLYLLYDINTAKCLLWNTKVEKIVIASLRGTWQKGKLNCLCKKTKHLAKLVCLKLLQITLCKSSLLWYVVFSVLDLFIFIWEHKCVIQIPMCGNLLSARLMNELR